METTIDREIDSKKYNPFTVARELLFQDMEMSNNFKRVLNKSILDMETFVSETVNTKKELYKFNIFIQNSNSVKFKLILSFSDSNSIFFYCMLICYFSHKNNNHSILTKLLEFDRNKKCMTLMHAISAIKKDSLTLVYKDKSESLESVNYDKIENLFNQNHTNKKPDFKKELNLEYTIDAFDLLKKYDK